MKQSNLATWGFKATVGLLLIINLVLTGVFGFTYIGAAFGQGVLADWAGGFYAVLIFDVAFMMWFTVYLRIAESSKQRSVAIGLSVAALLGSLAATLQQLATRATGLVDLSQYHEAVGMVALIIVLVITAAHIIGSAAYAYCDPEESERQDAIDEEADRANQERELREKVAAKTNQLRRDTVLATLPEVQRRLNEMKPHLVDKLAEESTLRVLGMLGFSGDGQLIGRSSLADGRTTIDQPSGPKPVEGDLEPAPAPTDQPARPGPKPQPRPAEPAHIGPIQESPVVPTPRPAPNGQAHASRE